MILHTFKSIWSRLHWNRLYIYFGYSLLNLIFAACAGFTMVFENRWYLFYFILPVGFGVLAYFGFTHWLKYIRIFFVSVILLGFFSLLLLLDYWSSVFTIGFSVLNLLGLCFQHFDRTQYASNHRDSSKKEQKLSTQSKSFNSSS